MKILTILGSPKKKGNTASVLSMFEEQVKNSHETERINITAFKVNGCLGCGKCRQKPDEPGCIQKDDAVSILERMISSDFIVYASPLYCWDFTSQMRALIDRHFCLVSNYGSDSHNSLLKGKKAALLVTCNGPIENNSEQIQTIFDRFCNYAQLNQTGKYILPLFTTPEEMKPKAAELAAKMIKEM